nr:hypothetical protein [uncultured Flavobacterium sp.]
MEQLTPIQPTDYGLSTEKAQNISMRFSPKELEFNALIQRYNTVLTMDLDEALNDALVLKKDYIAIEKSINEIHKAEKDFYLNGGRFVDAQKNRFIVHIAEHKKKLDEIIKYKELQKKAELKAIADARHLELNKYMNDSSHIDVSSMSEEVYEAFKQVKCKEWEDAETLKQSNEIIAKIYQSETFEEFNAELFGSHIEERKKQINASRLLAIANYNGGDLGFELDTEELQKAYNDRLIVLDGIRVERIKNEMQRLYSSSLAIINNNITSFQLPIFDAQEFTDEWEAIVDDIEFISINRKEYLSSILQKMPDTIIKDDNVYLGDKVICNINQLSDESIVLYNLLLGGQQAFENWVNSFTAPGSIDDARCTEVLKKFEAFKKWALTVK